MRRSGYSLHGRARESTGISNATSFRPDGDDISVEEMAQIAHRRPVIERFSDEKDNPAECTA